MSSLIEQYKKDLEAILKHKALIQAKYFAEFDLILEEVNQQIDAEEGETK